MIEVKSPAFSEGDEVPTQFTCDGENISPPLRWSGVPEEAAELRVSLTDPDAPRGPFLSSKCLKQSRMWNRATLEERSS
jgi:phosphatidylethanolamine-binding protein (PEBP) family uncharacterized protein